MYQNINIFDTEKQKMVQYDFSMVTDALHSQHTHKQPENFIGL